MADHPHRRFTLGIDVGGTNTDGVLYDTEKKAIAACTKEPTDHLDYKHSIDTALRKLLKEASAQEIISLNISTTLSTNALLEGKGSPVALILIGYDDFPHIKEEILSVVSPSAFISISGGHTSWGVERKPLDLAAVTKFAGKYAGSYFAVSSLYSPRNPIHESAAADIIRKAGCAGITCGHEMARSRLNSVKRTISAYLNSSLIDVTHKLISGVEFCAASHGLSCPVMFLRSDSSLVGGSWCSRFPLETIFSGPAASMRGASLLAGVNEGDAVIADMGGTSTDIGRIRGGSAVFSAEGATIGAYRTMIPSLEIHSAALGGDSAVRISDDGGITIGPERVVPCCRAAGGGECGFTPTDAVAVLGAHQLGDWEKSAEAARVLGEKIALSGEEFARRVRGEVSAKLDRELAKEGKGRRICVGAPAAAYSESAACCVPHLAEIASAA
ncbi:MAG: hydantoinase/oxoprolinase family protein, partial [Synergistes sp.]|nr:hydantoinase/oxoprolinase family protein [Synergistes sp.]